jgi:hypothetical protein
MSHAIADNRAILEPASFDPAAPAGTAKARAKPANANLLRSATGFGLGNHRTLVCV